MRINRDMLIKLAKDTVEKQVHTDHTLLAVYLQGSLLSDTPLIGNTADIDLFFVHTDEVIAEREIVRVTDEVHLDISHHSHKLYRQPRELRLHPWLGPAVYGCKILYDPQHFMDFSQASVRGQFDSSGNILKRARQQVDHAREMWTSFYADPRLPNAEDASSYLRALDHAANAVAGLSGALLTERRFLLDFPSRLEQVHKPGLYAGFLGLLGAPAVDAATLRSWLPEWQAAYTALVPGRSPLRLHPHRLFYYERAIDTILGSEHPYNALWPLWRTWTHAICALPADTPHRAGWQKAGEQLGILGSAFSERIAGLDAYIDTVEDILDAWAREKGA
jgi:hypothetical protein